MERILFVHGGAIHYDDISNDPTTLSSQHIVIVSWLFRVGIYNAILRGDDRVPPPFPTSTPIPLIPSTAQQQQRQQEHHATHGI